MRLFAVQQEDIAGHGEMLPQTLFHGAAQQIVDPSEILGGAAAVPGLDEQNQRAAGLQAGFHVVDGLGALIQGHILGETAAAGNDRVGLLRHFHPVDAVHRLAGLLP